MRIVRRDKIKRAAIGDNTEDAIWEYAENGFGHSIIEINKNHIDALLNGKAIFWYDGEYTTSLILGEIEPEEETE